MPPPTINLEQWHESIQEWWTSGQTLEGILASLKEQGVKISKSTLQRSLRKWDMQLHPPIALEAHRESIASWYAGGLGQQAILEQLHQQNIEISASTLTRALAQWRLRSPQRGYDDSDLLRDRICHYFRKPRNTDADILYGLREEHFNISMNRLKEIRLEMGLAKAYPKEAHESQNEWTASLLQEELEAGRARTLGVGLLYLHMRKKYGIVGRNRLREIAWQLDPDGFQRRNIRSEPRLGVMRAEGPNHVWSMDAHCKFEQFGIQIYAAIDSFSRYVLWTYVGISGRTGISVLVQYLATIADAGVLPEFIRSDRGAETELTAGWHYEFSRRVRGRVTGESPSDWSEPAIESEDLPPAEVQTIDLRFQDCYRFGTSKANQRIESYWAQQAKMALNRWRRYFLEMVEDQRYNECNQADRIAFLAIYMPILREAVRFCADLWNDHYIRKQPKVPHAVSGVPEMLYRFPEREGYRECGYPVPKDLVEQVQSDFEEFDLEEYMPFGTRIWCEQNLRANGFNVPVGDGDRDPAGYPDHARAYTLLKQAIERHIASGRSPALLEDDRVSTQRNWRRRNAANRARNQDGDMELVDV